MDRLGGLDGCDRWDRLDRYGRLDGCDRLDGLDRLVGYLGLFLLGRIERRYRNKPSIIFIVFSAWLYSS